MFIELIYLFMLSWVHLSFAVSLLVSLEMCPELELGTGKLT